VLIFFLSAVKRGATACSSPQDSVPKLLTIFNFDFGSTQLTLQEKQESTQKFGGGGPMTKFLKKFKNGREGAFAPIAAKVKLRHGVGGALLIPLHVEVQG